MLTILTAIKTSTYDCIPIAEYCLCKLHSLIEINNAHAIALCLEHVISAGVYSLVLLLQAHLLSKENC